MPSARTEVRFGCTTAPPLRSSDSRGRTDRGRQAARSPLPRAPESCGPDRSPGSRARDEPVERRRTRGPQQQQLALSRLLTVPPCNFYADQAFEMPNASALSQKVLSVGKKRVLDNGAGTGAILCSNYDISSSKRNTLGMKFQRSTFEINVTSIAR